MWQFIKLIFIKEMKEVVRDKRSWLPIIAVSIFMPLSIMGGLYFSSQMEDSDPTQEYSVTGVQNAPALISFLNAEGLITTESPADGDASALGNGDNDDIIRLTIPDDFQEKMATGYIPTIVIRADYTDQREAVRTLRDSLQSYASEVSRARLSSRGVSPIVLQPFKVDIEDIGDVSAMARLIAPILIFMFIMVPIPALMPAAIDCTAGERERHGLFPLLLQPIPAIAIPIGKYLMLVTSGMVSLAISISVGFYGYPRIEISGMNIGLDMSFANGLLFLLILLPTVMVLAAIIMAVSSFAKSFKEGQTYVGLSPFLPMAFFGAGFAADEIWRPYIPFWSENMVASNLLSGTDINWLPWLITVTGYMAVVAISMWWISRTIRRQALAG